MEKQNNSINNLIKIIQNVFLGEKNELTDLDIDKICKLARFHSIEYIVYQGLKDLGINVDEEFEKIAKTNAYKTIVQELELKIIEKEFSKEEICFLPLKGAVLKNLYPKPEYRNMSDIDILVKEDDSKKAGDVLKKIGYTADTQNWVHNTYNKKPFMHVEIHRALFSETINNADYYDDLWDSPRVYHDDNDKYHYYLKDEDFYIYMVFHAYKHFLTGGTGLRTIIDEYIYLNDKKALDFTYINQELEIIGLLTFNNILKDCVDYIFYRVEKSNKNDVIDFIDFVIDSGVYGTSLNSVTSGVIENGTKNKFIFRRLFPTFKDMKLRYPILGKAAILLPWFYFTRLLKGLFNFKKHKKDLDQVKNVDEDVVKRLKRIKEITGVE